MNSMESLERMEWLDSVVEGSHGENVHGMASVGPGMLTKTIQLYSRLDNFDYILRAWNWMENSTLLQCEPGWDRHVQRWVTLVECEPSIFSMKQHDTACSRLNHTDLTYSTVHRPPLTAHCPPPTAWYPTTVTQIFKIVSQIWMWNAFKLNCRYG